LDISLEGEVKVCPKFGYGAELLCCPEAILKRQPEVKLGMEKFLTLWILLAVLAGVALGQIPHIDELFETLKVGNTNVLTAAGMIVMLLPPCAAVKYDELAVTLRKIPKRFALGSLALNWIVGPALMMLLGVVVLRDHSDLLQGVIFIGAARCIAMVLVWTAMAGGDSALCVSIVLINSSATVILYTPVVTLLGLATGALGVQIESDVSFLTVLVNVMIYLGIPLVIGIVMWCFGRQRDSYWSWFLPHFAPLGMIALLLSIVVMFAEMSKPLLQGSITIVDVLFVTIPLVIYFSLMFALAWIVGRWILRATYSQTVVFAFTAASNNFELALAACTAIFGTSSNQAVATVIGPLIEIPVMLALVKIATSLRYGPSDDSKSHVNK